MLFKGKANSSEESKKIVKAIEKTKTELNKTTDSLNTEITKLEEAEKKLYDDAVAFVKDYETRYPQK